MPRKRSRLKKRLHVIALVVLWPLAIAMLILNRGLTIQQRWAVRDAITRLLFGPVEQPNAIEGAADTIGACFVWTGIIALVVLAISGILISTRPRSREPHSHGSRHRRKGEHGNSH